MPEHPNIKLRHLPDAPNSAGPSPDHPYAELDVSTNFSFLRGASHPDELVYRAAELGYRAIAVTDRNTLAGIVRMHEAAKVTGLKLLVGARLAFTDAPDLLVWAADRPGYARLCRLLTTGKRRTEKGECTLRLADFLENTAGLLAAADVPDPLSDEPARCVRSLRDAMGERLSLAISRSYSGDEAARTQSLLHLSRTCDVPLLATNAVHYHDPARRALQDVLTCVRHGCTIHEAGYKLFPNGERYLK